MSERTSDAALLNPVFLDRWSTRTFSSEPVTADQIAALFEAARWSPSWMNGQPWYFVYETDGPDRQAILDTFMEFNREWAARAPMVGLIIAKTELDGFMGRSPRFRLRRGRHGHDVAGNDDGAIGPPAGRDRNRRRS